MKFRSLPCLVSLLLAATPAFAVPLKLYKQSQKTDSNVESLEAYIDGVGNGIFWANSALLADNKAPLFCSPDITLNQDNYLTLLERGIKDGSAPKTPWHDDDSIEMILLRAMQHAFPCKK